MTAPRILAQGAPCQAVSYPGAKYPAKLSLKATIGANGQPTVVSTSVISGTVATTISVSMTETANDSGIYDVVFPGAKLLDVGSININVLPAVLATTTQRRVSAIDKTAAQTAGAVAGSTQGRFRFSTSTIDATGGAVTAPVSGSEIHANFWVEYG